MTPLRPEDIQQLRPIFDFYDTDLDGRLSAMQVGQAFQQLGFGDSNMAVTLTDFPAFCRLLGLAKKRAFEKDPLDGRLRLTFRLMVKDNARQELGAREFLDAAKAVGVTLTSEQAERIAELIYPEDGTTFNENEFVAFVKQQIALS